MPIHSPSDYRPSLLFRNPHLNTVYASLWRSVSPAPYRRERLHSPDDDFLDLDWIESGAERLIVICHGLEGSSRSLHIQGLATAAAINGWDALAWNYRGCSGEVNRLLISYHSGKTDDLSAVLSHALARGRYQEVALVGFSLGANVVLKFLGEAPDKVPTAVKTAVAVCAPCDLAGSAAELTRKRNYVYLRQFLRALKAKTELKAERFPGKLSLTGMNQIKTLQQFDDRYTAPIHGFDSADHYYSISSSGQYLSSIQVPTLIINPLDDPFLGQGSFPCATIAELQNVTLEMPNWGGHVGFMLGRKRSWVEERIFAAISAASRLNGPEAGQRR